MKKLFLHKFELNASHQQSVNSVRKVGAGISWHLRPVDMYVRGSFYFWKHWFYLSASRHPFATPQWGVYKPPPPEKREPRPFPPEPKVTEISQEFLDYLEKYPYKPRKPRKEKSYHFLRFTLTFPFSYGRSRHSLKAVLQHHLERPQDPTSKYCHYMYGTLWSRQYILKGKQHKEIKIERTN